MFCDSEYKHSECMNFVTMSDSLHQRLASIIVNSGVWLQSFNNTYLKSQVITVLSDAVESEAHVIW